MLAWQSCLNLFKSESYVGFIQFEYLREVLDGMFDVLKVMEAFCCLETLIYAFYVIAKLLGSWY